MRNALIVLCAGVFLLSCSVQKRKYQKGFYVQWKKHELKPAEQKNKAGEVVFALNNSSSPDQKPAIEKVSGSSEANDQIVLSPLKAISTRPKVKHLSSVLPTDTCDNIVFMNGDELPVQVQEITKTEIRYRRCDIPNGPAYVIKKNEVFLIRYANGTKEVFGQNSMPQSSAGDRKNAEQNAKPKYLEMAIIALGFSLYPYTCIVGLILGILAYNKIKRNPGKYKGEPMAITAIVLSAIILAVFAVVLLISLGI